MLTGLVEPCWALDVAFVRLAEEVVAVGKEEILALLLSSLEPNQRLLRGLEAVDGARLLVSALSSAVTRIPGSFSPALSGSDGVSGGVFSVLGVTSTSSASRYHFLRRV